MSTKTKKKWMKPDPKQGSARGPARGPARGASPPRRPATSGRSRYGRRSHPFVPIAAAAFVALIVTAFVMYGGRGSEGGGAITGRAPDFSLPSTGGGNVSLGDFSGQNLLIYFNEGAGCDACFYQMVEIEKNAEAFTSAGVTVVPVVANPVEITRGEMARFGLTTPYLVDADTSVSSAYGMLGKGMHANLPGHGFVLIDGSGMLRWKKEYPTMYVGAGELLDEISRALA